ncbi:hypothetical protein QTO34_016200 [Cnephaeus nilssonii]|uniref:non-specific serine/threonine protein kinase n=1 Tax=Cnephaeus nilssonii TaxID=3371016 RepID=A0AA40I5J7_CNENI|nr:hypothetical protein QTO34_016200 [Eptesicus nilssonii]
MTVKLADFGFSREVSNDKQSTFCGTICYSAPEILQRHTYDGRKTDVWSLGVVLYRMLTGVVPFEGDNFVKVKRLIISGHYHVPHFMSREVQKLLRKLLTVNPSRRPTLEDVMKDPWLNKGQEETLRPYSELPWGDLDPQVTEMMQSLGFKQDDIQKSVAQRKFDRVMGTYLILRMMKTKMPGRTIRDPHQEGIQQRRGLLLILTTMPAELVGLPGAPRGQEERLPSLWVHPSAPT